MEHEILVACGLLLEGSWIAESQAPVRRVLLHSPWPIHYHLLSFTPFYAYLVSSFLFVCCQTLVSALSATVFSWLLCWYFIPCWQHVHPGCFSPWQTLVLCSLKPVLPSHLLLPVFIVTWAPGNAWKSTEGIVFLLQILVTGATVTNKNCNSEDGWPVRGSYGAHAGMTDTEFKQQAWAGACSVHLQTAPSDNFQFNSRSHS